MEQLEVERFYPIWAFMDLHRCSQIFQYEINGTQGTHCVVLIMMHQTELLLKKNVILTLSLNTL